MFSEPKTPRPDDDERELLLGFVHWQREQVVATAEGLTDEQARWRPGDRLLPILSIINHLTRMEWRWMDGRYLGAEPRPQGPELPDAPPELTLAGVIEAYAERAERTAEVVRAAPSLDEPLLGRLGDRPPLHELFGFDRPVSLRWGVLHVLEETAHHAGHADATREMLDGRRMRA